MGQKTTNIKNNISFRYMQKNKNNRGWNQRILNLMNNNSPCLSTEKERGNER